MSLTGAQQRIIDLVNQNESVCFTGPAGTGKSHLISEIIKESKGDEVAVTSSTGVTSVQIGGSTLHSFVGLGVSTSDDAIQRAVRNATARNNITKCKRLIIDEISMIHADLFVAVSKIFKMVNNTDSAFGGIQLIVSGDFLQLPPVDPSGFCFKTSEWKEMFDGRVVYLDHVFRQSDEVFKSMLNSIRVGKFTNDHIECLSSRIGVHFQDDIVPVHVFPKRSEAAKLNQSKLSELSGREISFAAEYKANNAKGMKKLKSRVPALEVLKLKVGASVMLVWNVDVPNGLANGSQGIVKKFETVSEDGETIMCPVVLFKANPATGRFHDQTRLITPVEWDVRENNRYVGKVKQIPLIPAWAITIHKSQGMTLDAIDVSVKDCFETGQFYVAISRVKTLEGLRLSDATRWDIKRAISKVNKDCVEFYESITQSDPVVGSKRKRDGSDVCPAEQQPPPPKKSKYFKTIPDVFCKKHGTKMTKLPDTNPASFVCVSPNCDCSVLIEF